MLNKLLQAGGAQEARKRGRVSGGGSQFSIDELLRQDDKRSRFEADSKSVSVGEGEVGPEEEEEEEEEVDVSNDLEAEVKQEMEMEAAPDKQ